jgi:hypothetical protein
MAAVAADEAAAIAPVAADEAASTADEAAAAVDEAASATDEAAAATDEAAEAAASAAGVVSAGLLQAARAATATATREANRSDLFMNFLEEKFWVRTNTGNPDTRPHGRYPSKRQQAKLEHFLCLARHYTHPYGTFSESQCHR